MFRVMGVKKIKKQDEEMVEEPVMEEEETIEEVSDADDKIEDVLAKLDEVRSLLIELADAIKASADATKGLHEVVTKMVEKVEKEIETPEEANKDVEAERKKNPDEPEPAESAEEVMEIVEPERVQRRPEYETEGVAAEVGKEIRKKSAVTPRPIAEINEPSADGEMREFIKTVLSGKMSIGEINEVLKEKIIR